MKIIKATKEEQLDIAIRCHHDWYVLAGYVSSDTDGCYVDEWTEKSVYYLTSLGNKGGLKREDVVGVVRLITEPPFPLDLNFDIGTSNQEPLPSIPITERLEVSALSWAPKHGSLAIPQLYRAIWQGTKALRATMLLASLDSRLLPVLQQQGFPVHVCGPSKYYLGSETMPTFMSVDEITSCMPSRNRFLWDIMETPLDVAVS
ncbi:MAG: hypothetical protein KDI03_00360 [Anaerolineae bacterium]|nr:hypothetical protein [Anaerolineae bacterium]MCB0206258.1 hypothetical protein [Anaerolineae bacterium]